METTPEELLRVIRELYPKEYDRSVAELVIKKQAARIHELEDQLKIDPKDN